MAQMFKCDKCSKQIESEIFYVLIGYIRTEAEIKELLINKSMQINEGTIDRMREASKIIQLLEVCKGCYDEYKKVNFK